MRPFERIVRFIPLIFLSAIAAIVPTSVCLGQDKPPATTGGITPQAVLDKSALKDCEVHVLGVYSSKVEGDDRLYVEVQPTGKPMVVVLSCYMAVEWHIKVDPKADVRQIIVGGYYSQEIHSPPANIPVAVYQYFGSKNNPTGGESIFFYAYRWHSAEGRDLRRKVKDLTGLDVMTFQGASEGKRFVIDGIRGRSTVEGKDDAEQEDRSSKSVVEAKDISDARVTLEAARRDFESQFERTEETTLKAAQEYRAEAAQKTPDDKKLAALKQKLQTAVNASFNVQLLLQKTRIELAQLDLMELQAKHQRRESLAAQVIERRVADLIAADDLKWTNLKEPKPAKAAGATDVSATGQENVLLYFKAAWAGPCQKMNPIVAKLQGQGLPIRTIDIDQKPDLAKQFKIDSLPCFVLIVNGRVADQIIGATDEQELRRWMAVLPTRNSDNSPVKKTEPDYQFPVAVKSSDTSDTKPVVDPTKPPIFPAIPDFETPQQLLEYLAKSINPEDVAGSVRIFAECMEPDEQNRIAGVCLRTASLIRSAAKVAEGFSALTPNGENAEVIRLGKDLDELIKKARLDKPSRAAQVAFDEISASEISMFQMMFSGISNEKSKPAVDARKYSAKLRKAAGVLKDPRQFVIDFVLLMKEMSDAREDDDEKQPDQLRKQLNLADWDIKIDGNRAVVTPRDNSEGQSLLTFSSTRIELIHVGNTWRISSMMTDEMIIEIQAGITKSSSSEPTTPAKPATSDPNDADPPKD